jgi:lipopolysaccharide export system protein LptA
MLYPILPPILPAVVSTSTPSPTTVTSIHRNPSQGSDTRQNLASGVNGNIASKLKSTISNVSINQSQSTVAEGKVLSEQQSPEFSPLTGNHEAKFLGETQSIGYQNKSNSNLNTQETESESSPVMLKEPIFQSLNTDNNSDSKNIGLQPQQQPVKINFNSGSGEQKSPQPSTIEFKTRSQVPVPTIPTPFDPSQTQPQIPTTQPTPTPVAPTPTQTPENRRIVEVLADRQEYDEVRKVVTAEGNVIVRFDGSIVNADRLQVSLDNLIAVGDGNVILTRGDQVLRGQKFTYNFIQDDGQLEQGRGEIFIPTAGTDLSFTPGGTSAAAGVQSQTLSDRINRNQPISGVGSPGGINLNLGGSVDATNIATPKQGGQVRRIRFEAAKIDFYPRGFQARDVRLTNDPFSPPELELRADKVTLTRESPLRDSIKTQGQRLVFDQKTSLGIPKNQQTIDRRERDATPAIASISFDGDKRGGLFIERKFQPINTETTQLSLTPQFFAQKAVTGGGNLASLFGLKGKLSAVLSPKSNIEGTATFDSLDLSDIEENLRAGLRFKQALGDTNPHILNLEYIYRDRLYNGTLGFQRVQSSLGGVVISPVIPLGKSGLNLSYQAGAQLIDARTDRLDLLDVGRENDRIYLGRFQANARLFGGIPLWEGKALASTPTEGLRYTANPVVPYLKGFGELNATSSYYTTGDTQNTLFATVGVEGQIGHFSKPVFDYTGFRVSYSQGLNNGLSPFLFDRSVDNRVINLGLIQQIYGPFRLGFQTSINLDNGRSSSTEYSLEYSRRTYGIVLRYNPVLELGGISFRISDFNWSGGTDPFSDQTEVRPVVGGVEQRR